MRTGLVVSMVLFLAACAPRHKSPAGSGMGSELQQRQAPPEADSLSAPVRAVAVPMAEGRPVYRFLLTGHDQQRLDLRVSFDGREVCRVAGRLDAATHAHEHARGPRVDNVCVVEGPVENEERVQVRLWGFTLDAAGARTEVDQQVEADFIGFFDGWIELADDGQAAISFPKG